MNRQRWVVALMVGVLTFCGAANTAFAQADDTVAAKIAAADDAVSSARAAIAKGKELVAQIPDDSPYMPQVTQMLQAASANWKIAVESLKGAKESADKSASASTEALSMDYALLARVNANVAVAGALVVEIGLDYVEAVAGNKTESLDLITGAMNEAVAGCQQVQFNYDRVKALISEKYSK